MQSLLFRSRATGYTHRSSPSVTPRGLRWVTRLGRSPIVQWSFWIAALGITTLVLFLVRVNVEQSHVALTLLLIVLGGSATGGRRLGFTLALLGFVVIDYLFQPPFNSISVEKPLDWVVLVAFLAAAFVATELVTRARAESGLARARSSELASLSRLGSETLRHARSEDALLAIADLVQATLSSRRTAVRLFEADGQLAPRAIVASGDATLATEDRIADLVASDDGEDRQAYAAAELPDGSVLRGPLEVVATQEPIVALVVPLVVESRRLGLMIIGYQGTPRPVDGANRRFLSALSYYAALGAERLRLEHEAEQARLLREENRAKDEVLATVSHDLRTPLTTIKALAQRATELGESCGTPIEVEVDRLAELVTKVLDLSRIRAGGIRLDLALNTAEDLIGAVIRRAGGVTGGKRVVPHIDLDAPAVAGHFDFVQSLRIVGNLVDNALRYTPPGGAVDVFVQREGPWLAIRVADRGPGVPATERERIFEPFYRPRSESPDGGHAGLGLSIARRLADLQGGSVDYEPRAGGGSVFTLKLPATDAISGMIGDDLQSSEAAGESPA